MPSPRCYVPDSRFVLRRSLVCSLAFLLTLLMTDDTMHRRCQKQKELYELKGVDPLEETF